MRLKKFTIEDIRSWGPCYDPTRHLPEGWKGNALEIAENGNVPFVDVLWVVARKGIIPEKLQRRFAAYCAAEALFLVKSPVAASWEGVKAAIKFSTGSITKDKLATAGNEAWDAARAAARAAAGAGNEAWAAAEAAAWATAGNEAWDAAWDVARDAAEAAAWAAARDAARDAARAAVWDAARDAAWAAVWDAARDAAWAAQRKKLISMLKEESDFNLSDLKKIRGDL
jgi:hypothetical protein